MDIKELKSLEDFKSLTFGQQILVEWSDYFVKHHEKSCKVMLYRIYKHKRDQTEIICQVKENHYFNYNMFLGLDTPNVNTSQALSVKLIIE